MDVSGASRRAIAGLAIPECFPFTGVTLMSIRTESTGEAVLGWLLRFLLGEGQTWN